MEELIGKAAIQKWEYKIVFIRFKKVFFGVYAYLSIEKISQELDSIGSFGWELASSHEGTSGLKCIFKRPLP